MPRSRLALRIARKSDAYHRHCRAPGRGRPGKDVGLPRSNALIRDARRHASGRRRSSSHLDLVPDLHRPLAACELAAVQGGLNHRDGADPQRRFLHFALPHAFEHTSMSAPPPRLCGQAAHGLPPRRALEGIAAAIAAEIGRDVDYRPMETHGAARARHRSRSSRDPALTRSLCRAPEQTTTTRRPLEDSTAAHPGARFQMDASTLRRSPPGSRLGRAAAVRLAAHLSAAPERSGSYETSIRPSRHDRSGTNPALSPATRLLRGSTSRTGELPAHAYRSRSTGQPLRYLSRPSGRSVI